MKLSGYLEAYQDFSRKASDVSRQLAFAGIALLWIFHKEESGHFNVPEPLIRPAILFVAALALDLLHAVSGAFIWGAFHRYQEKRLGVGSTKELSSSKYLTWPINFFFWTKLGCIFAGYILLLKYLVVALSTP